MVQLPYFTVDVWQQGGSYSAYVTGGTYADLEDTEELAAILTDCLSQEQSQGTIDGYNLRYLRQDNGLYQKLAFVDMSMEQATLREMMGSYLQIGAAAMLLLLGVSILLSRWATRPVERAWRQQRQFLTVWVGQGQLPLQPLQQRLQQHFCHPVTAFDQVPLPPAVDAVLLAVATTRPVGCTTFAPYTWRPFTPSQKLFSTR